MLNVLLKLYLKFQNPMGREEGQDLVEYALVVALVSLGAVAGIGQVAQGVNNAYATISTTFGQAI
ncbi:MAG: Flp family type IVb pilin [Terracidiphilus sp.]